MSTDFCVTAFCANRAIAKLARANQANTPSVLYRGIKGRMRTPFVTSYAQCDDTHAGEGIDALTLLQGSLGRLADGGLFSTTSDTKVATGTYGGELLFVIQKDDQVGLPGRCCRSPRF
jgi:hypothetical protein